MHRGEVRKRGPAPSCSERRAAPVHHRGRRVLEVLEERLADGGRQLQPVHRRPHVAHPRVALLPPDGERRVAHPQPGMAALLAVPAGATPVLDQEQAQVLGRGGEHLRVPWIQRPEHRVAGHPGVEALDQPGERLLAAGRLVDGLLAGHSRITTSLPSAPGGPRRMRIFRTWGAWWPSPAAAPSPSRSNSAASTCSPVYADACRVKRRAYLPPSAIS